MWARALVSGLLCAGCATAPPRTASGGVPVAPATGAADPAEPPARAAPGMKISSGGVGDFHVGEPIPARYLDDGARYEARWVADVQPMEGFLLGAPPVWVILDDGPMQDVEPGPIEELKAELAPKALAAARAGLPIGAVLVEEPDIRTEAGIGVASTYDDLVRAFGDVELLRSPEWFDSKITCDAHTKALPGVRFLLESCEQGKPFGAVKRIWVSEP